MPTIEPVRFDDGEAMLVAGVRGHHQFDTVATSIPNQWSTLMDISAQLPGTDDTTYGVICGADPVAGVLEYLCGYRVAAFDGLAEDVGRVRIPEARYAVFEHRGSVATIGATWQAIFNDWLPTSGKAAASSPDYEVYGKHFDSETGSGVIEIWLPVEAD